MIRISSCWWKLSCLSLVEVILIGTFKKTSRLDMPGVYTTGHYDTNEWEPVDMVTVSHNESVSMVRGFAVGIGQMFGGKSSLLEKKIMDLREGIIKEAEKLVKEKGDNYMIVGFDMETSGFESAFIVIGTGTLLRKKKQSGGASCSSKTRRRR